MCGEREWGVFEDTSSQFCNQSINHMTPFEQAHQDWVDGKTEIPDVWVGHRQVNYFLYQIAVHKYHLRLMSLGIKANVRLKDIKEYYGLKGRSGKDVYKSFIELIKSYNINLNQ